MYVKCGDNVGENPLTNFHADRILVQYNLHSILCIYIYKHYIDTHCTFRECTQLAIVKIALIFTQNTVLSTVAVINVELSEFYSPRQKTMI